MTTIIGLLMILVAAVCLLTFVLADRADVQAVETEELRLIRIQLEALAARDQMADVTRAAMTAMAQHAARVHRP